MEITEKTFKEWMTENLEDSFEDIYNHGVNAGFPGLTYYTDTCALYDAFEDEIWEIASEESESLGSKNIMEFIAGFGCAESIQDITTFKNAMTWYAAEYYAREYIESKETE